LVAAVANLNLSVANVALPSIGAHFDSGQTTLDLIAVGYSLGLACSVLWLGALGDRYGRKSMLLLGTVLAIPMSLPAAMPRPTPCCSSPGSTAAWPRGWPTPDDAGADHRAVAPRRGPDDVNGRNVNTTPSTTHKREQDQQPPRKPPQHAWISRPPHQPLPDESRTPA
jgi:Major Facilitator Superfamily